MTTNITTKNSNSKKNYFANLAEPTIKSEGLLEYP